MSTFIVEEERGTYSGHLHPHNGYYAGDFGARADVPSRRPAFERVVRLTAHRSGAGRR